jgi:hypothetical protein
MDSQIIQIWKYFFKNKANVIRALSCFTFLLFLCPFLQTCSNEDIKDLPKYRALKNDLDKANFLTKSQEDFTYNFYELAIVAFIEFESKAFLEVDFYIFILVDIILILALLLSYFSLKRDFLKTKKLALLSLSVLLIYTVGLIYNSVIVAVGQIRYGYYLVVVNLILIAYFSNEFIKGKKMTTI